MSRIGKKPISLPDSVKVQIEQADIAVTGPKGALRHSVPDGITVELADKELLVSRASDNRTHRALHGLTRSLIANMVEGVSTGFKKQLEIVGVGYKAEKTGNVLNLSLGLSHPVEFPEPDGISIDVDKQIITVEGIDKCLVGQTAAQIRKFRKPDVYKGKGVRYVGETVRRKVGKAGAK